jgi:hypothetical protein
MEEKVYAQKFFMERDHSGFPDVDVNTILKWILGNMVVNM